MKTAAIYARVSSDQQREEGTIASQTAALVDYAQREGYSVPAEWVFQDEGYSGVNLARPGLERVRDLVAEGQIQAVLALAPDRLSRKYAYQVLLTEELARCGVEMVFVNAPPSGRPADQLLVQFQGMIAEYERAQILERSRRGKRHRAKQGEVSVLSAAPYGYRYVPKSEQQPAGYEVIAAEAQVVQEIFHWYTVAGLSIGAITRRLNDRSVPTKKGGPRWERSTVWAMLRNPAYRGRACFGKTQQAGRQRLTNRALRQRSGPSTRCSARKIYNYRCLGSDAWRYEGKARCEQRPLRLVLLEQTLWSQIVHLLEDPSLIHDELDRRPEAARNASPVKRQKESLSRELAKVQKAMDRLLTAYQEALLLLEELRRRMPALREREKRLEGELSALSAQLADQAAYLRLAENLSAFLQRLRANAQSLNVQQRQCITRLLVKEVVVAADSIAIRHSIPTGGGRSGDGNGEVSGPAGAPDSGQADQSYLLCPWRDQSPLRRPLLPGLHACCRHPAAREPSATARCTTVATHNSVCCLTALRSATVGPPSTRRPLQADSGESVPPSLQRLLMPRGWHLANRFALLRHTQLP